MLKTIIRQRPKHLLSIYVEPTRIETLWSRRSFRRWDVGRVEQVALSEGEQPYEHLQRMGLRAKGAHTGLVLFLARSFYSFHRECYPAAIVDQLEETLTYDWPENIFYEDGQMLHFHGEPAPAGLQLVVPIFSLQQEVYDKFYQCLDGASFQTFTVVPGATAYRKLLAASEASSDGVPEIKIAGRQLDSSQLEVNRFLGGLLQDSVIIRAGEETPKLFFECARCSGEEDASPETEACIRLLRFKDEPAMEGVDAWEGKRLAVETDEREEPLLASWTRDLLNEEETQGFGAPVYARPWRAPKALWVAICLVLVYSVFALYKAHERSVLANSLEELTARRARLEAQWKPIEQLQQRIPQLQEAQKALAQFGEQSYPVVGLLTLLSNMTPEDTWLNFFSVKGDELTLRGESKSAIKYLGEFSKAPGFHDARFASPVSKNPSSDMERFHIQIQVTPDKLKQAIDLIPPEAGGTLPPAPNAPPRPDAPIPAVGPGGGPPLPKAPPDAR